MPGRLLNSLTKAFNECHKLPRFLVIAMDVDLLSALDIFKCDIVQSIRQVTTWIVKQVNIMIRRKCIKLLSLKPGMIYGSDPTVIFVRMICRINNFQHGSYLDELYSLRAKFNDALNDAAAKYSYNIATINSCNTDSHFDHLGRLSAKGKTDFWYELDDLLERFDHKDVKLLPNPNMKRKQSHY